MSRPASRVPYLRVIRGPRYFPLWLGQIISNLGDTLNYVALVVLVFRLSQSGVAVSALVLAEIVPTLLLGPIAGVVMTASTVGACSSWSTASAPYSCWSWP